MLDLNYGYSDCLAKSDEIGWKLDDVLRADAVYDFGRRFLPDSMVRNTTLDLLSERERLTLNQLTARGYFSLLGQLEQGIIAGSVRKAQLVLLGENEAARALVRVAEEEFKHQLLFERAVAIFDAQFPVECAGIEIGTRVSELVISRGSLPAVFMTLHLELVTQWYYSECVRRDNGTEPLVKRVLEYHWFEEFQHAKIDTLELVRETATTSDGAIDGAIYDYLQIAESIGDLVATQADLDVRTLEVAIDRRFDADDFERLRASRAAAYGSMFVVSGMLNPHFLEVVHRVFPEGPAIIEQRAKAVIDFP